MFYKKNDISSSNEDKEEQSEAEDGDELFEPSIVELGEDEESIVKK